MRKLILKYTRKYNITFVFVSNAELRKTAVFPLTFCHQICYTVCVELQFSGSSFSFCPHPIPKALGNKKAPTSGAAMA